MAKQQIATQDLFVGIHRAHRVGDSVPAENIDANGWGDLVAAEGTKAANAAAKQRAEQDGVEEEAETATTAGGSAQTGSSARSSS